MSYQKQNFANGEVLTASQLNHIEQGIVDVESAANATKTVVDKIIDPTLSLSGKAADAAKVGEAVGKVEEDLENVDKALDKKENLVIANSIESGVFYSGWTIGNPEKLESNSDYVTMKTDLSKVRSGYITCNSDIYRNAFLLYLDESSNVISYARESQDTSKAGYVYATPENARYLRISFNNSSKFLENTGVVVLDGIENISSPQLTKNDCPYETPVFYAGALKTGNRQTVDERFDNFPKTYHVEKDGTGDFVKLTDAIIEAVKYKDSIVYVGAGTWDIVSEYGSAEMETMNKSKRGLYLKNGIHLICSSRALITAKYTGTNDTVREWFSAFNAGENGFVLENAKIETENIRYSVHDERDSDSDSYTNKYVNCDMTHTNGFYVQCIGGGLGLDGHIVIDGCRFKGKVFSSQDTALVSYHNSADGAWDDTDSKGAQSFIEIKGCYLADKGAFNFINFGKSDKLTTVLLHDNSIGGATQVTNGSKFYQQNVEVLEWNSTNRNSS